MIIIIWRWVGQLADAFFSIIIMAATVELSSCVSGHHIYKDIWSPMVGEELGCTRHIKDPYAVAVMRASTIVRHIPRRISADASLFLQKDGSSISCKVTGQRRYSSDLLQGGLEVPCLLTFSGNSKEIAK